MISGVHVVVFAPDGVAGEVSELPWGVLARIEVPGLGSLGLYEPRHPRPPLP